MDEPPVIEPEPPRPPTPQEPTMSLAARLLNVFAVPGDVFAEVKVTRPSPANWLAPMLLFLVVSWVAAGLIFSQPAVREQLKEFYQKTIHQQVQKGRLPAADEDRALQTGMLSARVGAFAGPVFVAAASPFWWGLILWVVGTRVMKADFPYMKAVEVSGLAGMIGVLEVAVKTLLVVGFSNPFASPSLAGLLKNPNPHNPTYALLSFLDIMTFWALAVRAIGLARLSGAPFLRAAVWILGIWVMEMAILLSLSVAAQGAMGGA